MTNETLAIKSPTVYFTSSIFYRSQTHPLPLILENNSFESHKARFYKDSSGFIAVRLRGDFGLFLTMTTRWH